jgi:H+/gluconate symporter-like permease
MWNSHASWRSMLGKLLAESGGADQVGTTVFRPGAIALATRSPRACGRDHGADRGQDASVDPALPALAIGCGSLFLSHVNDAGFWLIDQYFGMTVKDTFKTWSAMETLISVVGMAGVMILSVIV